MVGLFDTRHASRIAIITSACSENASFALTELPGTSERVYHVWRSYSWVALNCAVGLDADRKRLLWITMGDELNAYSKDSCRNDGLYLGRQLRLRTGLA